MLLAAANNPAGGAAIGEVILASVIAFALTAIVLGLVWLHHTGRTQILTRAGTRLGNATGVPPWVALPTVLTTLSLLTALFGMLWDISLHIDVGRDPGPLANPAHYFILFGLFGVFSGGIFACAMPLGEKPGPAAVRFIRGWDVPVGGLLITGAGFYALLGFPLDDMWHRLFGQDVTLWGPTHLMLITGAGLSIIGILILEQEGHGGLSTDDGDHKVGRITRFIRQASAMGGLLLGLSVFQAEYDFDVEQFRLVLSPFMIAGAAGLALVAARLFIGRGGALAAAAFFLVIRGVIALLVGPLLGQVTPTFPLYLGSAIVVELLALSLPLLRRTLTFGAVAGLLIGTVGFATEFGWSHIRSTLSWGTDILVEGTVMAVAGGVAGGLLGALLASGLRRRLPRPAVARTALVGSLVVLAVCVTNGLLATVPKVQATFGIQNVTDNPRTANITVQLDPANAVDDPSWVQITAWQGHGLVVDALERTGEGQYKTTQPIPIHDDWKALLRLHDGRTLSAVPIYLPKDPAIPADEIAANDGMTPRQAIPEIKILQRELTKSGGGLWLVANLVVLACTLALIAAMSWGVARYSRRAGARDPFAGPSPQSPDDATPRAPSGLGSR